jgi:ProP effector
MVKGKKNVEATITELVKAFPAAFTLNSSQVRPLKLGIKDDIYARSDMSHRRITVALRIYCGGANYLAACTEGAVRVDLAGEQAGSVTGAEAEHAVQALSCFRKSPPSESARLPPPRGAPSRKPPSGSSPHCRPHGCQIKARP